MWKKKTAVALSSVVIAGSLVGATVTPVFAQPTLDTPLVSSESGSSTLKNVKTVKDKFFDLNGGRYSTIESGSVRHLVTFDLIENPQVMPEFEATAELFSVKTGKLLLKTTKSGWGEDLSNSHIEGPHFGYSPQPESGDLTRNVSYEVYWSHSELARKGIGGEPVTSVITVTDKATGHSVKIGPSDVKNPAPSDIVYLSGAEITNVSKSKIPLKGEPFDLTTNLYNVSPSADSYVAYFYLVLAKDGEAVLTPDGEPIFTGIGNGYEVLPMPEIARSDDGSTIVTTKSTVSSIETILALFKEVSGVDSLEGYELVPVVSETASNGLPYLIEGDDVDSYDVGHDGEDKGPLLTFNLAEALNDETLKPLIDKIPEMAKKNSVLITDEKELPESTETEETIESTETEETTETTESTESTESTTTEKTTESTETAENQPSQSVKPSETVKTSETTTAKTKTAKVEKQGDLAKSGMSTFNQITAFSLLALFGAGLTLLVNRRNRENG